MILTSNVIRISGVNAASPSCYSITSWEKPIILTKCFFIWLNFLNSMVSKLKAITEHNHCYRKNKEGTDNLNRGFKIRHQENTMCQKERDDLCVHHRVHVSIIMSWRALKRMLEISRTLKVRFLKTQHLEKQNIKNNRSHKIGIKAISETKPFGCKEGSNNRQETHSHPDPKPPIILYVDDLHFIPVLSAASITLLKPIQKLFYVKNLELSCLFLQKHGAFFLSKEAKSLCILIFLELITNLTHRICAKP